MATLCLMLVIYYIYLVYRFHRRESFAVIVDSDGVTKKVMKLNLSRPTFRFKGGRYNIVVERAFRFDSKKLLLYRENSADPLHIPSEGNSRLDADTYQHILDNAVIRALNASNALLGMDLKKWALIGVAVAFFFIASAQGWI